MSDDWLQEARTRLASRFEPGCWIAVVAKAIDAATRDAGAVRERTPAHYLVGAWAPAQGGLYPRLPEFAAIASPDGERALRELFAHLPPKVRVHLTDEHHVDVELLARMVLECDRNLEAYQREALERFAERCRLALTERIRQRYTDRETGFERFRDRLLGGDESGGR